MFGKMFGLGEADHSKGTDNLLMGCGGLETRDEMGGTISCADSAARAKTGGRGMSRGEAMSDDGKEQRMIRPDNGRRRLKKPTGFWYTTGALIASTRRRASSREGGSGLMW
jgi:hypothetical protein